MKHIGGGLFMKPYPKKNSFSIFLNLFKIVCTIFIIIFPTTLNYLFPFCVFLPFFTFAFAYGGFSKFIIICSFILSALSVVGLILSSILLILKKGNNFCIRICITLICTIDIVAFLISLAFGSLSIGKIIGIVFNLIIMGTWRQRDGSKPLKKNDF